MYVRTRETFLQNEYITCDVHMFLSKGFIIAVLYICHMNLFPADLVVKSSSTQHIYSIRILAATAIYMALDKNILSCCINVGIFCGRKLLYSKSISECFQTLWSLGQFTYLGGYSKLICVYETSSLYYCSYANKLWEIYADINFQL